MAENMEDEKIKSDGRDVRLEEDPDLQLPFLLPEDGYSCDTIRGIPNGLGEFIEPLARAGKDCSPISLWLKLFLCLKISLHILCHPF